TKTAIAIIEAFAKIRELSRNIRMLSEIQDEPSKNIIMKKSGGLIAEILDDPLRVSDTETTIEINFAVIKFKHLVKKKK
ncbi:MAG: ORF6N domain-containing protein, partial [Bacteroidota bacterium]